jgi:hypothetical protein
MASAGVILRLALLPDAPPDALPGLPCRAAFAFVFAAP